jgi:hypothetical protein
LERIACNGKRNQNQLILALPSLFNQIGIHAKSPIFNLQSNDSFDLNFLPKSLQITIYRLTFNKFSFFVKIIARVMPQIEVTIMANFNGTMARDSFGK